MLTSYSRQLVVKICDQYAKQINLASAWIEDNSSGRVEKPTANWRFEEWHSIKLRWRAPGQLSVILDDNEMETVPLDRPLGGGLNRLCLGCRPGNWRFYGKVKLDYMRFG